jgi:ComF family protein
VIRALHAGVLDLLLPRRCAVSGRPLRGDEPGPVAPEVLREVVIAGADYCTRCGATQGPGVGAVKDCRLCRDRRQGFRAREIAAVGDYSAPLKQMCLALKFGGERAVARPLGGWLAQLCFDRGIADRVDAVVPMPLHILRRYERGYNQAALIAREVAAGIGRPLWTEVLQRVRATSRQARLSAAQRRANVDGAFEVRAADSGALKGRRVLLVDDVMTTGATLHSAAIALRRAGVVRVDAWVCARAP